MGRGGGGGMSGILPTPWACPHLSQIFMTFPTPHPPLPPPQDSTSSSEPRYLQVPRILGQENGDRRLLTACRVSCIRLGSDDCKNKTFGKSCQLSPPLSFQSASKLRLYPLGHMSFQAAWCFHAPYREGAGSHTASRSLWPDKVVRLLGLAWQERLSSKQPAPVKERE